MSKHKTLSDFLSQNIKSNDVYTTDTKKRERRTQKGYFSRGETPFDFINLINCWDKIVGKMLSQNTIPQKINRGTLIVAAKHPIFAQELGLVSPQIIKKIESNIPALRNKISKIKYNHSNFSWEEFQKETPQTEHQKVMKQKLHPFSPEFKLKKKKALEVFQDIEDDEFKELLVSLFIMKDD